ncbi:MAG: addiction module protein [Rugosibacter sp.]
MASIDIVDMPVEENLKLMESLWDSLCATHAEGMSTPRRHGDVLAERACRLASGEESVSAWSDAKERIRSQIKAN